MRKRLRELTAEVNSLANRRLGVLLRREGWAVNHNRVYQLYREEGLAERRHNRVAGTARVPLRLPTRANQVWTMGFAQYTLASGWKFRTLNLMDITAGPEGRLRRRQQMEFLTFRISTGFPHSTNSTLEVLSDNS